VIRGGKIFLAFNSDLEKFSPYVSLFHFPLLKNPDYSMDSSTQTLTRTTRRSQVGYKLSSFFDSCFFRTLIMQLVSRVETLDALKEWFNAVDARRGSIL